MNPGIIAELGRDVVISQYHVLSTSQEKLATYLLGVIGAHAKTELFFVNTNFVVKSRCVLEQAEDIPVVLVNDGIGMDIASMLIYGTRFEENLNGTDFTPYLFARAGRPLRVFMIGGTPDVLAKAVDHVSADLGQIVVGSSDGFHDVSGHDLLDRINEAHPEVVLVAMGNPVQEQWILDHAHELVANVFIGVGALFDFWAGTRSRAPKLMREMHLEWFYRLCLEPKRLARRYTLDIVVFLRSVYKYRRAT